MIRNRSAAFLAAVFLCVFLCTGCASTSAQVSSVPSASPAPTETPLPAETLTPSAPLNAEHPEPTPTPLPTAYELEAFPMIYQMPELPTGCEITALTMAMRYYDFPVDKVTMCTRYLPILYRTGVHTGSDGLVYGNDMYNCFIGDPASELGIICGPGAIVIAANQYFADAESSMQAVDASGMELEDLYRTVANGDPVVVWVTINMVERSTVQGWYTEEGRYIDWGYNDHCATLIGYSETTVTIADPLAGIVVFDRERFERSFASRGNLCVILQDAPSAP